MSTTKHSASQKGAEVEFFVCVFGVVFVVIIVFFGGGGGVGEG